MKRNLIFAAVLFCAAVVLMCGCGRKTKDKPVFALIPKCETIRYMHLMHAGFDEVCEKLGVRPIFRGPDIPMAEGQISIVSQLAAQGVDGIVVNANDPDALQPVLTSAARSGIKIISADSPLNSKSRLLNVNSTKPEDIGRILIRASYEMLGGKGGLAILSAAAQTANQNEWIYWMRSELEENPEKYKDMPLIKVAYGDDDPVKGTNETLAMLKDPRIKLIISPTTVGMLAAGKVLQNKKTDVKLTGLGLPSDMAPFIRSGVCPWIYLWDPIDQGRMAAYAMHALYTGKITGKVGEKFTAGEFGEVTVEKANDGGTEIVIGQPLRFDLGNIDQWEDKL